jgi:hypothetical protein
MGDIHFDDGTPWHVLALVGGGGSRERTALRREQGTIQGNASRHLIQSVEFRPQRTA